MIISITKPEIYWLFCSGQRRCIEMSLSLDCAPFRLKETSNLLKLKYWKRHKLYLLKPPKGTHWNIERVNLHVYALWTCCGTMETNTPALEEAKCIHQNSLIQSHDQYMVNDLFYGMCSFNNSNGHYNLHLHWSMLVFPTYDRYTW